MRKISYARHRFPLDVIQRAVWLYPRKSRGTPGKAENRWQSTDWVAERLEENKVGGKIAITT